MKIVYCAFVPVLILAGCAKDTVVPPPWDPLSPSATVFFASDSAAITPPNMPALRNFAEDAKKSSTGGGHVFVCGHADRTGSAAANMEISRRRADAVRQALVDLGVPADLIVVFAKGDKRAMVSIERVADQFQDRRVDVNFEHPLGLGGDLCRPG